MWEDGARQWFLLDGGGWRRLFHSATLVLWFHRSGHDSSGVGKTSRVVRRKNHKICYVWREEIIRWSYAETVTKEAGDSYQGGVLLTTTTAGDRYQGGVLPTGERVFLPTAGDSWRHSQGGVLPTAGDISKEEC